MYSLLIFLSIGSVHSAGQSIVDKSSYFTGESFNITCDVSKFSGLPDFNYLQSISLLRQTSQKEFYAIAQYQPFLPKPDSHMINLPDQWTTQFFGEKSFTNRNSMRIIVTVQNFQCADAGLYKCRIVIRDLIIFNSTAANITSPAKFTLNEITVDPKNGTDKYTTVRQVNENIALSCTFSGPPNFKVAWKYSTKNSTEEELYPNSNHITDTTPAPSLSTDCTPLSYSSVLKLQVQQEDDGRTYFCIVLDNGNEVDRANISIAIRSTLKPRSQTESAGSNNGTIVVGLLVFLVIVVVLVYFFVIRKKDQARSSEDKPKTDKDSEI